MINTKSLHEISFRPSPDKTHITMRVADPITSNFDDVGLRKEELIKLHDEIEEILELQVNKKEILYLFKVTRKDNWFDSYDVYDQFIVVAPHIQAASEIHPGNERYYYDEQLKCWKDPKHPYIQDHGWPSPEFLEVENIGLATDRLIYGTIVSRSFNKG